MGAKRKSFRGTREKCPPHFVALILVLLPIAIFLYLHFILFLIRNTSLDLEPNKLNKFTVAKLETLDGGKEILRIDKMIAQAAKDCVDRAGVKKPRSVVITLNMVPYAADDDLVDQVVLEVTSKVEIPGSCSKTFVMDARGNGVLLLNDLSPDQPKQRTIDEGPINFETGEIED